MPVYASQFGAVQTAYVAYKKYDLASPTLNPLQLSWPTSYQDSPNVVAAYMDFENTSGAGGKQVQLPNATEVSVGQNIIMTNRDEETMFILNFDGTQIDSIPEGISKYYILNNNSTSAGAWSILTFGAGTAVATASELVGYGLNALTIGTSDGTKLNTQIRSKILNDSIATYNILVDDYTKLLVWTAPAGDIYLPATNLTPSPTQVPPAYYVSINNGGTGPLTLRSSEVGVGIQGQPNIRIDPGQTLSVISNGTSVVIEGMPTKWFTLGFGQTLLQEATYLSLPVGPNTNVTLTASQSSNEIIEFTGELTGDIFVYFPARSGQWSLFNNTTGAFTLTIQLINGLAVPIGTPYVIGQGNRGIYYSNSLSLFNIPEPLGGGLPGGALDIGQVLNITSLGPQVAGWGPVLTFINETLGMGLGIAFPAVPPPSNVNVFCGIDVSSTILTGTSNVILGVDSFKNAGNASRNVGLGNEVFFTHIDGDNNTAIGDQALAGNLFGSNSTAVGANAGSGNQNGFENTFVGYNTNTTDPNIQRATAIGTGALVSLNNTMVLGNDISVGIGTSSPLYGLHLGPPAINFHPTIHLDNNITPPTIPSAAGANVLYVAGGQPYALSDATSPEYSGTLVTAKSVGGASTTGTATLVAGTVTVGTTAVKASSIILITVRGFPVTGTEVTVSAIGIGTGFSITSSDGVDTRDVFWLIVNPEI